MKEFKSKSVCVGEDEVAELVDCLDEQVGYIKGLYPGAFEEWNEENCLEMLEHIEELIAYLGEDKKTSTLIKVENKILELLHKANLHNVVVLEPNDHGDYRVTRKHLLQCGFTPEEIDSLAQLLLKD